MQSQRNSYQATSYWHITLSAFLGLALCFAATVCWTGESYAAGGKVTGPNVVAPNRYVYYPGTEVLKKDEIRVIACGTGMPAARRGQAATCFLVETGNGDKFIFDIGSGSMANLAALMIPYQYLDKVFLTHLHTDHMGDIASLWAGGWTSGRPNELKVWGPSGMTPEMGTKYSMEHFLKYANWDYVTRKFQLSGVAGIINAARLAMDPEPISKMNLSPLPVSTKKQVAA